MKIGLICSNYSPHPGGLEAILKSLATGLADENDVAVLTTEWDGVHGTAIEAGVRIDRLPAIHLAESFGVPYPVPTGRGLRNALRAQRGRDVLHANGCIYTTSFLAARLSRKSGIPLVLTEHVGLVEYRNPLWNVLQRVLWSTLGSRIVGQASALIAYNARVLEVLRRRFPEVDAHFVANGIDAERFRPPSPAEKAEARLEFGLPPDSQLVLFAGRDTKKKNLPAVVDVPRDGFRLVVCGARRKLPADVIDLGLVPHDRMHRLFWAVDFLVHAAFGEGFPVAIQEAMASGVPPVILWDEGYGHSLRRDVVVTCSELSELRQALHGVLGDPGRHSSLSAAARSWAVENWKWDRTLKAHLEIYEAVVRSGRYLATSSSS